MIIFDNDEQVAKDMRSHRTDVCSTQVETKVRRELKETAKTFDVAKTTNTETDRQLDAI